MNGWALTLLITLVLGVVVSNLMLLKHSAKMKVPKSVLDAIQKKKQQASQEEQQKKKPKD
ncbi:MAG: DUF2897 family protein [Psychromonas sp.]